MKRDQNKSRSRTLYIFLAILLVIVSVFLVLKPVMRKAFPLKYEEYIVVYSNQYNLDKYLVMGMISTESKFDEDAVSHKDARGLMQLTDETANWCIEKFNIPTDCDSNELNINIGCSYLRYLLDKYNGNVKTALAAYNAGEGNVTEWLSEQESGAGSDLSEIPFKETADYVERVEKRMKIYRFLY